MRQPEIKEAGFKEALPLQLSRVIAANAPQTKATVSHMQLTAFKRADKQLQHRVQLYTQATQHSPDDKGRYYSLFMHYQPLQPTNTAR